MEIFLVCQEAAPCGGHSLVRIAHATTGDVAQQKPIGSKPIPGRKAHDRSGISSARRKPTIFDAVSRLVPPPRHVCERQELLASDALTRKSAQDLTQERIWMLSSYVTKISSFGLVTSRRFASSSEVEVI